MVDYSKWDKLELSDDSDVEVHPNIDKKSFIRWKQRDIHDKREQRRQHIAHLKAEEEMNAQLLIRINKIVASLKERTRTPAEVIDTFVRENAAADNKPAAPGAPTFLDMMLSLLGQVKQELSSAGDESAEAYIEKLGMHRSKLSELQDECTRKLKELEDEEKNKITSEGLREGFNRSIVNKSMPSEPAPKPVEAKQTIEVLNSSAGKKHVAAGAQKTGYESDDEEEGHIEPSPAGREFAKIKAGDFDRCLKFIKEHPEVVSDKDVDGLFIEAFHAQSRGEESYARQCVSQALLLQYCKQLGKDGVALFFKRVTTPGHQARQVYQNDVEQTYDRIRVRAKELASEKANQEEAGGVEQIQLHAVDPDTEIEIHVPPADSDDTEEQEGRKIFESFPPGLQRALESGSLDEVNVVLGKMAVDQAEEIVGLLGQGGMLSVEEKIYDATKGPVELPTVEKKTEVESQGLPEIDLD
ncbi:hsp90 co-chaperone Cdc37 [Saitoella coloradoensis]